MLTPYGHSATQFEKVMLLSMWANHISKQNSHNEKSDKKFIFAGLGKPTYPINQHTVKAYKSYWDKMGDIAEKWHLDPDAGDDDCAIGYGDPYGDTTAKEKMAQAMSKWYDTTIKPENVLFTVGGIGGLKIIFEVLNNYYAKNTQYRVITPFPHYSAYTNNPHHILHPINVMSEKGYQLTAQSMELSIKKAYSLAGKDGVPPKAVLICNPSNPLGTIIKEEELKKIAIVLRQYPELHIIFDEAYAEMNFIDMPSFLKIAPDLKTRTIVLRSATKALSAAGERMAVILAFDEKFISELVNKQITSYIHPPRSAQIAYAETMLHFRNEDRKKMSSHYLDKVKYVSGRLKDMGAEMHCPDYQVEATFYAVGDFSDLFGMEMPSDVEAVLEKNGLTKTGEDLAYYLLFRDSLMVAPLSYFGLAENCGYLRITCSGKKSELKEMMDRLENRLFEARSFRQKILLSKPYPEISFSHQIEALSAIRDTEKAPQEQL